MRLRCPDCKTVEPHLIRRWQTEAGVFDAISTFCQKCSRTEIHTLGQGFELTTEFLTQASKPTE